jgi:phage terminase large subunit-like protein
MRSITSTSATDPVVVVTVTPPTVLVVVVLSRAERIRLTAPKRTPSTK